MSILRQLRAANTRRQIEWPGGEKITPLFRALEMMGEAGEAGNLVKKLERERLGIQGSRTTKERLIEELADVIICVDLVAQDWGIDWKDLEDGLVDKFNATSLAQNLSTRMVRTWPV